MLPWIISTWKPVLEIYSPGAEDPGSCWKAKNIEEILQIERELTRIRGTWSPQGEFEPPERVNFSSIFISLEEKDPREYGVVTLRHFWRRVDRTFSLNTNRLIGPDRWRWLFCSLPSSSPGCCGIASLEAIVYFRKMKKAQKEKSTTTIS